MREIKFRAWNTEQRYMSDVDTLDLEAWNNEDERPSNIRLMQYTGLKDKNGVEIYEGDIVNVVGDMFDEKTYKRVDKVVFVGKVYWREDRWHIKDKNGDDYDNGDYYSGDEVNWVRIEVIGNIYQNPELLKEATNE